MQVQGDPHHKGGSSDQGIFTIRHEIISFYKTLLGLPGRGGGEQISSAELQCDLACTAPFGSAALELTC